MIELTRKQIQLIRSMFRQALGITSARRAPDVTLRTTPGGLLVQSINDVTAIEYRVETDHPPDVIAVPYEALKACEGRRDEPVRFTQNGDSITVEWADAGIPQVREYPTSDPENFPAESKQLSTADKSFVSAMADAVATTDNESTRYALSCVRLRGSDGQIAATDGRQALIQSGFQFPWDDDVLVPASKAFANKAMAMSKNVTLGRTEDWLTIRLDDWTLHLKIEKEDRFPNVDDHVPSTDAAKKTMTLSENDAEFLQQSAKRLPAAKEFNAPVTVDLNGSLAVRAKSADQATATELILSGSERTGDKLRINTNRQFLSRAAQLGFRQIHLQDAESPAFCRDDRRSYIWALLGSDGAIKPDANMNRIESPQQSNSTDQSSPQERTTIAMPQTTKRPSVQADPESPVTVLARAETLRDSLSQALSDTRELISAIKAKRKQNRLVESTLRSLKQLENIGA